MRRSPKVRYIAISAHDIAFPVTPLGILATLIPNFVAASMSTPSIMKFNKYISNKNQTKRKNYTSKKMDIVTTFKADTELHYELHLASSGDDIRI